MYQRIAVLCSMIFQFSPLREGRLEEEINITDRVISILAPARGATGELTIDLHIWIFQFSPLREGRRAGAGAGL